MDKLEDVHTQSLELSQRQLLRRGSPRARQYRNPRRVKRQKLVRTLITALATSTVADTKLLEASGEFNLCSLSLGDVSIEGLFRASEEFNLCSLPYCPDEIAASPSQHPQAAVQRCSALRFGAGDNPENGAGLDELAKRTSAELASPADCEYVYALTRYVDQSTLPAACFYRESACSESRKPPTRRRDLFPVPPLLKWPETVAVPCAKVDAYLAYANLVVKMPNYLYVGMRLRRAHAGSSPTQAQLSTQVHVANRVARYLAKSFGALQGPLSIAGAFSVFEENARSGVQPLKSDAVDLPPVAATCEPFDLIDDKLAAHILSSETVFP